MKNTKKTKTSEEVIDEIPNSFSTHYGEYHKDIYLDNEIIEIKE